MREKIIKGILLVIFLSVIVLAENGVYDNENHNLKNITNVDTVSGQILIGNLTYTSLNNYPQPCAAGSAITQLLGTPVCKNFTTNTQFQTLNTSKSNIANCTGSQVVQNTTVNGTQCVTVSSSSSGTTVSQSDLDYITKISGLNNIRHMWSYSVLSNVVSGMDGWGDAFIDSNGRQDGTTGGTVNTANFSRYINSQFEAMSSAIGAMTNGGITSGQALAILSSDTAVGASCGSGGCSSCGYDWNVGTTFSSRYIGNVTVDGSAGGGGDGGGSCAVELQTYNGATWSVFKTYAACTTSGTTTTLVNATVSGVRLRAAGSGSGSDCSRGSYSASVSLNKFYYYDNISTSLLNITIPSGTFPSNISQAIGVAMLSNYSNSAQLVQFKLKNANNDTGWISAIPASTINFTKFSSEPTQIQILMTPKLYPLAIKGFWVNAR